MLFCVVLIHAGLIPALFVFLTWSLPGALGMFALATGVGRIKDTLPIPVYALLSGLNSATVGIIALAAVQLSEKAITDRLTRILVIFGACAGLCYTALWYFPVLMLVGCLAAIIWDEWMRSLYVDTIAKFRKQKTNEHALAEENNILQPTEPQMESQKAPETKSEEPSSPVSGEMTSGREEVTLVDPETNVDIKKESGKRNSKPLLDPLSHHISLKVGISIIVIFFCRSKLNPFISFQSLILY
jgi:chromate transport protein ChrA